MNDKNSKCTTKTSVAPVRHGLRLIKTPESEQLSSSQPSGQLAAVSEVKPKKPSALVAQLNALADALDAEVAMILKM